jgi:hypothetical protein
MRPIGLVPPVIFVLLGTLRDSARGTTPVTIAGTLFDNSSTDFL